MASTQPVSLPRASLACLVAMLLGACTHTTHEAKGSQTKEPTDMAAPGSSSLQPTVSAEEIGRRFLKLLEGATSREDLSLERVQDAMRLTLERASGATFFGRSQPMEGGGSYIITFVPETASIKRGVGLDFTVADPNGAALNANCAIEFASYRSALTGLGFAEVPIYGETGQSHEWRYYRGDITLSLNVHDAATAAGTRACVTSVGTLN